ncbi:MAG: alkaline phosphatase family protein [Desulfarculaceae bacterium]|nr:alkaline phosphatase family protein [Desulfarculaceae bacterium]MCF8072529.1 alkaline phosphatase family protein [Desulfarculaceae bacterium]MCF8103670.1 alkaline phosphatase family protein [Desulfarculaceae bacterium]MCF8117070.1 alkaline phosphatase family protein [Desulfarculaceae bacterium]
MKLLKRFFSREQQKKRLFVLSMDGVSQDFALKAARDGLMPNLAAILDQGVSTGLASCLPTVSTVAWASYMTGVNPGKHGVYGLVERHPDPFSVLIPSSSDIKAPTLWEMLGRGGVPVGVMNVPLTFPPKKVNGFMVSGFLSPDLSQATYPVELAPRLMEMDYRIEADVGLASEEPEFFLAELGDTLARRFKAAFQLMREGDWEFFQLHLTGPDHINRLYWDAWTEGGDTGRARLAEFYRRLDGYLGELTENLPVSCPLLMVSGYGITRCQGLVYLNHWLEANGYLLFGKGKKELKNLHGDSKAYSLLPGRIYLNLEGREQKGSVAQGRPYEDLREELIHRIGGLVHPESEQPLVAAVRRREEVYSGPQLSRAPDLVVEPAPGYDFKANLGVTGLVAPPDKSGMPAKDDALFYLSGVKEGLAPGEHRLEDLAPTVLTLLGLNTPPGMEGSSLL